MVSTRSARRAARSTVVTTASSDEDETVAYSSATSHISVELAASSVESCPIPVQGVSREASIHTRIMTRKRRLVQEVEARLAKRISLYWEGGVERGGRGETTRNGRKTGQQCGGLGEVFGEGVLDRLPAVDKGPRVGHCSSGYVCGHPVPRGKEGNFWCQTPVRASLESKMACIHHLHHRVGAGGPSKEQSRYMLLADDFYDWKGDICWLRIVSYLRRHPSALEGRQRRKVIVAACGRALAVSDMKIVLHGFVQCTPFWLAACRLARRGYRFTMAPHASKAALRNFLADLRQKSAPLPPPSCTSSPFVCLSDVYSQNMCYYYAFGSDQLCRMF